MCIAKAKALRGRDGTEEACVAKEAKTEASGGKCRGWVLEARF